MPRLYVLDERLGRGQPLVRRYLARLVKVTVVVSPPTSPTLVGELYSERRWSDTGPSRAASR